MTVAFFDDFTDTVLGHHPDFTVGLANAGPVVTGPEPVRLYCPPEYLSEHPLRDGVVHRPAAGRSPGSAGVKLSYSRLVDPANLAAAATDAAAHGVRVFVNCYLDENYAAWPAPATGMRYVHSLHRPGYFGQQVAAHLGQRPLPDLLGEITPDDLFVVHSRTGERMASQFIDPHRLVRSAWPAASRAETAAWFDTACPPAGDDPYVLSIGSARTDKGTDLLMSALEPRHRLRIVGQQYEGMRAYLDSRHPGNRTEWETGWISRERLGEAIAGAAVVVFPYQPEFTGYGGASGALAQALTFGKPLVVSQVLADQVPESPACRVVPTGDAAALRQAVDDALRDLPALHEAAAELHKYVSEHHTYEGHLERILERCG